MANVKKVTVRGTMPFDAGDNPELLQILGQISLPNCGLQIDWLTPYYVNNELGGKTAFYHFDLHGDDAAPLAWLQRFVDLVKKVGGKISSATCLDIENEGERPVSLR